MGNIENKEYDVIIIGAGPGGIFCAYELLEKAPDMLEELSALAVRPGHLSERWNLTFNG